MIIVTCQSLSSWATVRRSIYLYNAAGQRVFKKVDGIDVEHYIISGSENVGVFKENGSLTHWNMLADGVSGRVNSAGAKHYYLKDHLGSTRRLDSSSMLRDYYPFGEDYTSAGSETDYQFTGKEKDGSELFYFGARYYDARVGRWMSVDPLASKYPSLSTYNYTANNPLRYVDPNGREIVPKGKMVNIHRTLIKLSKTYSAAVDRINKRLGDTKVPLRHESSKVIQKRANSKTAIGALIFGLDEKNHVKIEGTEVLVANRDEIATTGKQDVYTVTAHEIKHLDQLT